MFGSAFVYAINHADPVRLADDVLANLQVSGVSNPVTAVLLNFRAYDTLLELAVLLAAVLGILALGPRDPRMLIRARALESDPLARAPSLSLSAPICCGRGRMPRVVRSRRVPCWPPPACFCDFRDIPAAVCRRPLLCGACWSSAWRPF